MRNSGKVALDWLARANDDLQTARLAFQANGPVATIAVLLHEATEKALKGFLIFNGWRLKKTHDLVTLVNAAAEFDADFGQHIELAHQLNAFYLEGRYPTGSPVRLSRGKLDAVISHVKELFDIVSKALRD